MIGPGEVSEDVRARLFVAVVPPPDVLDAVEGWLVGARAALARLGDDELRWTTREQWHITLRFLGDAPMRAAVEAVEIDEAVETVGAVAPVVAADAVDGSSAPPIDAELGPGLRALGRGVLCLPVRGLDRLAGAMTAATSHLGRPPERRPFRAHLTLARVRSGRRAPRLDRLVEWPFGVGSPPPFAERFEVREIQLVRSTLRPSGAVYDVVARHTLRR